MFGNRKPRERYKDHYKPHPDGTDAIHIIDTAAPATPREKVFSALCHVWQLDTSGKRMSRYGRQLREITDSYSEGLCDQLAALIDNDSEAANLTIELAADSCGPVTLEAFVNAITNQNDETRDTLYKIFHALHRSRSEGGLLKAQHLTSMAIWIDTCCRTSNTDWDTITALIPVLTESEKRCIKLVHSRPELAGIIAERLTAGEIDQETLKLLALNPAPVLTEGTL